MANNRPTATWKQSSENGDFYQVTFTRSYQDDAGEWHDSSNFSGSELLRIAHLAQRAYDETRALRDENGGPS